MVYFPGCPCEACEEAREMARYHYCPEDLHAYRNYRILGIKCVWIDRQLLNADVSLIFALWLCVSVIPFFVVWLIKGDIVLGALVGLYVSAIVLIFALLLLLWASIVRRRYEKVCQVMNALEKANGAG